MGRHRPDRRNNRTIGMFGGCWIEVPWFVNTLDTQNHRIRGETFILPGKSDLLQISPLRRENLLLYSLFLPI